MATQPILLLNIEQGPKAGCSFECKAAAIATVGRARASTFQISRDPGISQKHLCFQWKDDDDAHAGWTAMDAGSSNGTIINGVLVEPHKGVYIHTGDLIKIGSETTIRVQILGVADEVVALPKAKEHSKRKGASESHGKVTAVAVRPPHKAGRAASKALAAQECQGKQVDVMEGEVYHGKHNVVEEGHGKQKDDVTDEVDHGKQHSNIYEGEGHGKQQDATAGIVFSGNNHTNHAAEGHGGNMTAHRHCQSRHDINNEAEDGQGKQGPSAREYKHYQEKHGINNLGNGKQDNEHEAEHVTAALPDIDLSMTVELWFQHSMEEGPKYLHRVSESIVQDIMLESKQFDEYVMSLS